jgi:DNA-binding response OmpR family regulator
MLESTVPLIPAEAALKSIETTRSWHILVAQSDTTFSEDLVHRLARHGHEVVTAATGNAVLSTYADFDFLLLDLDLPDLDGLDVCWSIRSVSDIPLIAVTSRDSEVDRVLGLQAGADDYVVKPCGFRELTARMDAVMRRARPRRHLGKVVTHGSLRIDLAARAVTVDGRPIEVTRKEFDLLVLLTSQPDTVIPRKRLMLQVWGGSWSRRTVDTHVSSLRNKLGSSSWIVTVRGVGYRLGQSHSG